jgi:hypothetical protein
VLYPQTQVMFYPGGQVASSGDTIAPISYWDGDSWRPGAHMPLATIEISSIPIPPAVGTSTSLSGGGTQNGGSRTLTAVVSGGATSGSVQFLRNGSIVSTKAISGGSATYVTSTTGTSSYTARYLGNDTHLASTSGAVSVTIRTLHSKMITVNSKWLQAYSQVSDWAKLSGTSSGDARWHQGRYSSIHGTRRSLFGFDRLQNMSGYPGNHVSITKVRLRFDVKHTYYSSGATIHVGWHEWSSAPTRISNTANIHIQSSSFSKKVVENTYINITNWAAAKVDDTNFKGIIFGKKSGTQSEYCYGNSAETQTKLEVTFTYYA